MQFSHEEQVEYIRLALAVYAVEPKNVDALQAILQFGETIKAHVSSENAAIYDATEYFYEQLRLLRHEPGAYDDPELLARLQGYITKS